MSEFSRDTSINLVKHDYLSVNPRIERNYNKEEFFKINPSPLVTPYEDQMQLCDSGMLIWGDSLNWSYYYGEELYHNFNLEEFDLFVFEKETSKEFVRLLNKYCGNKITLKERVTSDVFKVDDERTEPIFEITYLTH